MTAIFKREFRSFFHGMLGYVLTAFLVASSGLYFLARCLIYGLTDFSYYTLYQTIFMLLLYIPVLAMRSLAEERHSRTDQLLLTSPVSVWGIVLGKFFAMAAMFALPCAVDAVMIFILWALGSTVSALLANLAGLLCYFLLGCAAIALCEFLSGLTENQIIAAVAGFSLAAGLPDAQPAQYVQCGQRRGAGSVHRDRRRGFSGGRSAHPQLCAGVPDLCGALPGPDGAVSAPQCMAYRGFQRCAECPVPVYTL